MRRVDRPIDDAATSGRMRADHAAIDRLADELLPALSRSSARRVSASSRSARATGTSGSAARPMASGPARAGRRRAARPAGHAGHGHGPRPSRAIAARERRPARNGAGPGHAVPVGPGPGDAGAVPTDRAGGRDLAGGRHLPAPRRGAAGRGSAPATASAPSTCSASPRKSSRPPTASSAQPRRGGEAVEYGQELIVIELAEAPARTAEAMFRKILIANRGEIALRILRACRTLGVEAVVAYSEADRESCRSSSPTRRSASARPTRSARTSPRRRSSRAALVTGCDAIHPGYGFLSEDEGFAEVVARPRPDVHRAAAPTCSSGSPRRRRRAACSARHGLPTIPGSTG